MRTDKELYNEVYYEALNAKSIADEFDHLWRQNTAHNGRGNILYVNRLNTLPNCFQNTFNLLCSKDIWDTNGGFATWAKLNGVNGPLTPPSDGDLISKIITLFHPDNEEKILAIFALHQDKNRTSLDDDIANIRTTVVSLRHSLDRWKELFNY